MKSRRSAADKSTQCNYRSTGCTLARAAKPDGSLHRHCPAHRRHEALMQRRLRQHQRLLESIADTYHRRQNDPMVADDVRRAPRPRFVLLGNQQSLILGIVLSERGGVPPPPLNVPVE